MEHLYSYCIHSGFSLKKKFLEYCRRLIVSYRSNTKNVVPRWHRRSFGDYHYGRELHSSWYSRKCAISRLIIQCAIMFVTFVSNNCKYQLINLVVEISSLWKFCSKSDFKQIHKIRKLLCNRCWMSPTDNTVDLTYWIENYVYVNRFDLELSAENCDVIWVSRNIFKEFLTVQEKALRAGFNT